MQGDFVSRLTEALALHIALPTDVLGVWNDVTLPPGQVLWEQHTPATELGVVLDGVLAIRIGDEEVARVAAGEMIGETSAFIRGEVRTGSVVATTVTRLGTLGRGQLAALRSTYPDLYDALLGRALAELAGRLAVTDDRIAMATKGNRDMPPAPASGLKALWKRMTERTPGPPPPILPALRLLPVIGEAPEDVLVRIAAAMRSRFVEKGTALFLDGDEGDSLYLVGRGHIGVMRAAADERAYGLATLEMGALFGTAALFGDGRRTATCVAEDDAWVHSMNRTAFEALPGEVGRVFREGLLCAMRGQLLGADQVLVALRGKTVFRQFTNDISFDQLLAAAGSVLAWQATPATQTRIVSLASHAPITPEDPAKARLFEYIRNQIIGADEAIDTPYGLARVTYADYTASGRCLRVFEDYIREEVMPFYANTHTEASGTGRQTTTYREDARRIVAESIGANDADAIIFIGSGATGAIDKLVGILGLRIPPDLDARWHLSQHIPPEQRPVVFVGPYEHHSNILPWVHSTAEVVVVDDDEEGRVDLADLERKLKQYATRPLKIGSFSAASNVTGVKTETAPVAMMLHRHGALSFWDFAAAGPYTEIAMNEVGKGSDGHLAYKDAVFISPHKFIGGPGTPGILAVKRALVKNTVPTQPGGGTVALVTPEKAIYWGGGMEEHREEGGTPAILESIRAGLAFRLKSTVGTHTIEEMELRMVRRAIELWSENPSIRIIGSPRADRLSIVSTMMRHGTRYVHNNFIVTLLNDLFGIQARGGCSCAGPYMHRLLGVGAATSRAYVAAVEKGFVSLKPGWARVNFNYFISHAEFDYIVQAVDLAASYGWALMADYNFDVVSGQWHHKKGHAHEPMHLTDVRFDSGRISYPSKHARLPESALADQLARGRRILNEAVKNAPNATVDHYEMPEEYNRLRWFVLPHEVLGTANR